MPSGNAGWEFGEVANGQRGCTAVQQKLGGTSIGAFNDRCFVLSGWVEFHYDMDMDFQYPPQNKYDKRIFLLVEFCNSLYFQ